jgi:hypothetical protein
LFSSHPPTGVPLHSSFRGNMCVLYGCN